MLNIFVDLFFFVEVLICRRSCVVVRASIYVVCSPTTRIESLISCVHYWRNVSALHPRLPTCNTILVAKEQRRSFIVGIFFLFFVGRTGCGPSIRSQRVLYTGHESAKIFFFLFFISNFSFDSVARFLSVDPPEAETDGKTLTAEGCNSRVETLI